MERFDDKLKRMAQEEDFPLPDWAEACMQEALGNLPQRRKKGPVIFKYFGTALAGCLAAGGPFTINSFALFSGR